MAGARIRKTPKGITLHPETIEDTEHMRGFMPHLIGKAIPGSYTLGCCGKPISKNERGMYDWGKLDDNFGTYPTLKELMVDIDKSHENGCPK